MASRHQRVAAIGEYQSWHITASGVLVPVGLSVSTTSSTVITAGTGVAVTPASMLNIVPGMILNIANGLGVAENVTVKSVTATTFTADFTFNHSGAYTIISLRGAFLGGICINQVGSGVTITLYNGPLGLVPTGQAFAVINPATGDHEYNLALDRGLFYTVAVTGGGACGDYTISYADMPV